MNSEKIWIGPQFNVRGVFILGESWYGDYPEDLVTDDGYIRAYLEGKVKDPLYTRLANACQQPRQVFWSGVMFTNFVQRVGATRDFRPRPADYEQAASRLAGILRAHRPRGVWILGIGQGAYSAPVVANAGISLEVTAHPTSYGVKSSTLLASWQALHTKMSAPSGH